MPPTDMIFPNQRRLANNVVSRPTLAFCALLLLGCDDGAESARRKQLLFLIDVSMSVADTSLMREYQRAFHQIVDIPPAGGGALELDDPVFVAFVNDAPTRLVSLPFSYDPPPFRPMEQNKLVVGKARAEAMDSAARLIASSRRAPRTNLVESLALVSRALTRSDRERVVVIFSDMVEDSQLASFEKADLSPSAVDNLVKRIREAGVVPDLHQAEVWVVGSSVGASSMSSSRAAAIRRFWENLLTASNAKLDANWYSSEPSKIAR